jgi:hypothetical protein
VRSPRLRNRLCAEPVTPHVAWALEQLAAIVILYAQSQSEATDNAYTSAARTLGFVDARLSALGSVRLPSLQAQYDRVVAIIGDALGLETVSVLMAEGATMPEELLIEQLVRKPSRVI